MPVRNTEITDIFSEFADLLEIEGANQFRVRSYRTAARNISNLSNSIAQMVKNNEDLTKLPGLGKDLAGKVVEIVNTGTLSQLEDLKNKLPVDLLEITRLPGMGPKRTGMLYHELGITNIEQLEDLATKQKIRELPGFAAKTEKKILEEIEHRSQSVDARKRYNISVIEDLAEPLSAYLKKIHGVKRVEVAGSYRRKKETIGDLDILVTHQAKADVMEQFVKYEDVQKVISKGGTRSTVVLRSGLQVDVRVVSEMSYGAALHYFTGSQAHNIAIRKLGINRGLKINEYGVFKDDKMIAGKTEKEVYSQVDLPYIEPELRENNGEIEAAQKGNLPKLITLENLRGDLHSHTNATDGNATLEEMANAAKDKGYEYLAITEHSKHLTVAKGLDVKRLAEEIEDIDRLNEKLHGIVLLKGIEVDILEDGSLDLPDEILKRLDLIVCAIHYKFNLPADKQTERIIKGLDNNYFSILAHPTGRMINERDPYPLDMERLMKAVKETGSVLEINAHPERLDLTDIHAKMAKEMGIMIAISTDAHSTNGLDFMRFGVYQARRGWIEPDDVLNTRNLQDLKKLLKR